MVPSAVGANLDHITLTCRLAGCKALHFLVGRDAPTAFWQPWTEDIGDLNEHLRLAYRALPASGSAAEFGIALEFSLAVTDLLTRQRTVTPRGERGLTRQAIVDATAPTGLLQTELGSSNHSRESNPP